jgi:mono/diheme cytochrome c family protein
MKKVFLILLLSLFVLLAAVATFLFFLYKTHPKVSAAPSIKIEASPALLARGKYLVGSVAVCLDCHSPRDEERFSTPVVPGQEGAGGRAFDRKEGLPGVFFPGNLTPTVLGKWTDGEILRAITVGVHRDGHALFPMMAYLHYQKATREDLYSIIAYLRTLKPLPDTEGKREVDFPLTIIERLLPHDVDLDKNEKPKTHLENGAYLVNLATCVHCHSPDKHGQADLSQAFAGGLAFPLATGSVVRSPNITPDNATGIGKWTKEMFIARFKAYRLEKGKAVTLPKIEKGRFNTVMPWTSFAQMTDEDLGDIYDYLRTVKPITSSPVRFSPAL